MLFKTDAARSAARLAILYSFAASLWIFASDGVIDLFASQPEVLRFLQTSKGLLFVAVTATVLYFVLYRELRRREQVEAHSEYQAKVLQHVQDAVITTDLAYRIKTWNAGAERIYGWTAEEAIGKVFPELVPSEYPTTPREQIVSEFQKHGVWNGDVIHYNRDGARLNILGSIVRMNDETGQPVGIVAVNRDITERVRTVEMLEDTVELLNTVIEASPLAVIKVDTDWRVELWNAAAERLYGINSQDAVGKRVMTIPQHLEVEVESFRRTILAGEVVTDYETCRMRRDGTLLDVSISAAPIHDSSGKVIGALLMVTDITKRKRLEAEVAETEKLYTQLAQERKLQAIRTRFMRMVSHEFRTPLAIIHSSYELLNTYFDRMTPEQRQQRLSHIAEQIQHLRSLLDELSLLLHTDPSMPDYVPAELDIVVFCRELVAEIQRSVDDTHAIELIAPPQPITIKADHKLMRHVVNNLVFNAVKYSAAGSTITVRVEPNETDLRLAVQDRGIGIPENERDRIYDPFFRASNVEAIPGSGLGLAIVKQIVDLHRGTISLESAVGVGTTISVTLPINPAAETESAAQIS